MKRFWDSFPSWEQAETAWEEGAKKAQIKQKLSRPKHFPNVPGITRETKRFLKLKSLFYLTMHDTGGALLRRLLKRPFRYACAYIKSALKKQSYKRDGDFFLYGLSSLSAFKKELQDPATRLILGFSFCQKPLECPSGRFNDRCQADPEHPLCRQCPIGKAIHSQPEGKVIPLLIPTVHYIGDKIFEWIETHPDEKTLFLITACEMSLHMFSEFGNMIGLKGVGVRLDGRICNTFAAFKLAEKGIKPGLTLFRPATEAAFFELLKQQ